MLRFSYDSVLNVVFCMVVSLMLLPSITLKFFIFCYRVVGGIILLGGMALIYEGNS